MAQFKELGIDKQIDYDKFYLYSNPWVDGNGRMCRLLMNQLQFEFGFRITNINKDRKVEYIEALIATRENDDIELFRNVMFDEHIRNLEQTIRNY